MKISKLLIMAAAALALTAFLCSCAIPKIMASYAYVGDTKTTKTLMEPATKGLFNSYMRVCNLEANATETNCKDSLILENVTPRSL
jgi:hypothetical protein